MYTYICIYIYIYYSGTILPLFYSSDGSGNPSMGEHEHVSLTKYYQANDRLVRNVLKHSPKYMSLCVDLPYKWHDCR